MTSHLRNRIVPRRLRARHSLASALATFACSRYLTDGTHLYRFIGWGAGRTFAELEDCRSLELLIVSARELAGERLRPVVPTEA
ncbi:MAG TPA: hypothetical protein VED41_08705 [Solirubrobacteraceae bacterium]|nr:hypothetical protein [Solirubrobacteraceae bacterium]